MNHLPLRSIQLSGNHTCRFSLEHKTGKAPRHNKVFCDREIVSQEDTGSGNRSKTTREDFSARVKSHVNTSN